MRTDLLLKVAEDVRADDVDRIAALEALLLQTDGDAAAHISASEVMARIVLSRADDHLVRIIAAKEIGYYPCPSTVESLGGILLDATEDLDLRVNLLCAMERWENRSAADFISRIAGDDELHPYVRKPA